MGNLPAEGRDQECCIVLVSSVLYARPDTMSTKNRAKSKKFPPGLGGRRALPAEGRREMKCAFGKVKTFSGKIADVESCGFFCTPQRCGRQRPGKLGGFHKSSSGRSNSWRKTVKPAQFSAACAPASFRNNPHRRPAHPSGGRTFSEKRAAAARLQAMPKTRSAFSWRISCRSSSVRGSRWKWASSSTGDHMG